MSWDAEGQWITNLWIGSSIGWGREGLNRWRHHNSELLLEFHVFLLWPTLTLIILLKFWHQIRNFTEYQKSRLQAASGRTGILFQNNFWSKMFKFLNQCFARLQFWKSVSDSQNLLAGATAVLLETLFQNWSCAKHWYKKLKPLHAYFFHYIKILD